MVTESSRVLCKNQNPNHVLASIQKAETAWKWETPHFRQPSSFQSSGEDHSLWAWNQQPQKNLYLSLDLSSMSASKYIEGVNKEKSQKTN